MLKDLSKNYNEDQTQLVTQDIDIQLPMSKPEYKSMLANIKDMLLLYDRHQVTSTSLTHR